MDQDRFVQLLQSVLSPNSQGLKDATSALQKEYYTQPASLVLLIQLVTSQQPSELRQLAAVEARSLVSKHWKSIPAEQKPEIRTRLLEATVQEQKPVVRHADARVVSAIAKIDFDSGEWGELPGHLRDAAISPKVQEREVGVYILYTLLETMGADFMRGSAELIQLFSKTIQDPESAEVRINTMLALANVAIHIDADDDEAALLAFRSIIPNMVRVLEESIYAGDEERTLQAFEVFQALLGCDSQLLSNYLKDLVQFMVDIASKKDIVDDSRTQAISFLIQCVKFRRLKIQGMKIGPDLTNMALAIATELEEFDVDDDEITPARSALSMLDLMASCLPPSQVLVPLLTGLGQYVNSTNPDHRRAGILALSFCIEGAPDFITTQLKEIMPLCFRLLDDEEAKVRQAALYCIARLADDLAEDLAKEHQKLVPALVKNLDAAMRTVASDRKHSSDIIKASCSALDAVLYGLEEDDAKRYLPQLAQRFSQLFGHPDLKVKASAAAAMGSLASSVEEAFVPYFEATMQALSPYVTLKGDEDEFNLRAEVCDAMAKMAGAVGAKEFQKYVPGLMNASEEALSLENSRLKETSYVLWSSLAKIYEGEFTPFLEGVMNGLLKSLEQEERAIEVELGQGAADLVGKEVTIGGKKVRVAAADDDNAEAALQKLSDAAGGLGDDDDDDFEDFEDFDEFSAVTAVAMEKEIAVEVIGDVMTHTKNAFLPYFEKTVEMVLPLMEHDYEGIRKAAITTLHRAYAVLYQVWEETQPQKWVPGLPLKIEPTSELKKFCELLMTSTLALWMGEEERSVVTEINRNIAANLKVCGPALISEENYFTNIIEIVTNLLTKRHPCQQDAGEDEDLVEDDELAEYDWLVVDTALDVVIGLSIALGEQFGEVWKLFEKTIMKYASSSESTERSTAVGVIAECIKGMSGAVTQYTASLLKLLLHRLSDEDPETKSNAAYAIGRLCESSNSHDEILNAYSTILSKLEPLLQTKTARLMDNAAGCVSRMILKHREKMPIGEVLPALVALLPLKEDFEENEPIYKMITQMYQWEDPTIRGLTPQLLPIFTYVLENVETQLGDGTRQQLVELVKYLYQMEPSLLQGNQTLMTIANS
ncbi:MAG: hypothetical protein M1834_006097 [Cirrosporium novae-zelandiae]|nr:MAG: hypothetical protein M1834_006097 [Cirrosporium novae-zelandiae]